MTDTLLVVDVQEGMFSHPRYAPYRTEQGIEHIRALIEEARITQTPIVYVQNHTDRKPRRSRAARLLYPEIAPQEGDLVIRSRYADSFDELMLRQELESGRFRTMVVTGLDVEQCLDTACDLTFALDYDVTVVLDTYNLCGN
jgi:nicotinamidase-related amidase